MQRARVRVKSRETFGFGISREKQTRPETRKRRRKRGPRTADFVRVRETILHEAELFEHRVRVSVFSGLAPEFIGRRFPLFE